jgi:DHA2 family multidrug resistance protein-like MFS transporter
MGWRWIFVASTPFALMALAVAHALPEQPRSRAAADFIGMVLLAATFALLVLAVELARVAPMLAALAAAIGTLAGLAMIRREMLKSRPMIPLDLLRMRSFRLSVIASICCFAGQAAGLVALPFHLQSAFQQTSLEAGFYFTAWPAGVAVAAAAAGALAARFSTAALCAAGAGCLAAGLMGARSVPIGVSPAVLLPFIALGGVGFGLFQTPNNRNLLLSAPEDRTGAAGGMQGTARVSGQTVGALAMTLLFALLPVEVAPRVGLAIAAVFALLASGTSLVRATGRSKGADRV